MTIVDYALKFVGKPYIWAGDGSGVRGGGFDCSGLVLECLWAFGLYGGPDTTSQGLYNALSKKGCASIAAGKEKSADVLFFGKDAAHITHTAISIGNGLMVEAGGGGSKCVNVNESTGFVRIRPIKSRKDFVAALRLNL